MAEGKCFRVSAVVGADDRVVKEGTHGLGLEIYRVRVANDGGDLW